MSDLWSTLRRPQVSTALALAFVVVVGLTLMVTAYRDAAPFLVVPYQVPYLVSGSIAGIAIVGSALALMAVHLERIEAAEDRRRLLELQREALALLSVVAAR